MPKIGALKYIKKILKDLKGEIHSNIIVGRDFNTSLSSINRLPRQKFNKETLALNDTLDQMNLTNINRTFHPKEQNTHSSQVPIKQS